ncbi:MAG: lipoyl synthase [Oscillospiraceae bacterium]|nr:lipoyl synthase [Oscillospiraceae bacterium]
MMTGKPDWLRVPYYDEKESAYISDMLGELRLNTVCEEAACPNRSECYSNKTATFLILGKTCTRKCSFCNVSSGHPSPVDGDEPQRIAEAVRRLNLAYVVITSVTRDDLADGGGSHFASVISSIKKVSPKTKIEVLIPDFGGDYDSIKTVADAAPDVISHNIETVASLYESVRSGADYKRSLGVIEGVTNFGGTIHAKSGIMVGLGETYDEVIETFDDLRKVGCEFLTIGQYLSPTKSHYPVYEYITPEMFDKYADIARQKGFLHVASGPFVRSSYHADKAFED